MNQTPAIESILDRPPEYKQNEVLDITPKRGTPEYAGYQRIREFDAISQTYRVINPTRNATDGKILTGNSPEKVVENSVCSFDQVFGLSREMKALRSMLGEPKGTAENGSFYYETDEGTVLADTLWFKMSSLRTRITNMSPNDRIAFRIENPSHEALKAMMQEYLSELNIPDPEYLDQFQDDKVLYIGDPFQIIGRRMDEKRINTLEMETGEEALANITRTPEDAIRTTRGEYNGGGYRGSRYRNAEDDLEEYYRTVDKDSFLNSDGSYDFDQMQRVAEDCGWLFGSEKPEVGSTIEGFAYIMGRAVRLTDELKKDQSEEKFEAVKAAWKAVQDKLRERRDHYLEKKGIDVTKPEQNYDTSDGLHPIDTLSKSANIMAMEALDKVNCLKVYLKDIYPSVVNEFIEDLADAHALASVEGKIVVDPETFSRYLEEWNKFLKSKDIDASKYDPYHREAMFIENLTEFFSTQGTKLVQLLDPDLYRRIKEVEDEMISKAFPPKVRSKEARYIKGGFPYTQQLPPGEYDRIPCSWSWSAHIGHRLSTEQYIDEIWPELDRLLAKGGISVIYPFEHYGGSIEGVLSTIDSYNKKYGGNLRYRTHPSGQSDDRGSGTYDRDIVLVIEK